LYRGIDLAFYSKQQSLEYDFNVAPKADPSTIRIRFEGAENISIASNGDLVLRVGSEEIRHQKPKIYQDITGSRKDVEGSYFINDKGEVGFKIGQYNKSKPLVIDPILNYSTYLGGISDDSCESLAVDAAGNVYVTGYTWSSNFPITIGTSPPPVIYTEVFVTNSTVVF
jgi:hypothetical protein